MAPVLIVMAIATVMQAAAQAQQAKAAQANAQAQANAANYNAEIERQRAEQVGQETRAAEIKQRRDASAIIGAQKAGIAQSGLGYTGSALDSLSSSIFNADMDTLNIRYEGQSKAQQHTAQAGLDTYQAGVAMQNKKAAKTQGMIGVGSTLLSGYGTYLNQSSRIGSR